MDVVMHVNPEFMLHGAFANGKLHPQLSLRPAFNAVNPSSS
jgi:hypothetical protein